MNQPQANPNPSAPHKRRPRYRGTHPRRFHEKYKELNPEKYRETVEKVIASGKTPAGMHRPIMVKEVLSVLAPRPGETAVDCTLGYGGHSRELLKALQPGGRLIALDTDPIELRKAEERLRSEGWGTDQLIVRQTNFAGLPKVLAEFSLRGVDVLLADLGVSSMQLDDPARGFTCKAEGPLDLRMNPSKGRTGAEHLAHISREELERILRDFSDEPHAREIARAIIEVRAVRPLATTTSLARTVEEALRELNRPGAEVDDSIRRVFQAVRILVNDEFGALDHLLRILPEYLNPGGRAAFLSFHSGEDRRVKKALIEGARSGVYAALSDEPIRCGPEERRSNPRAGSARLRWARRA